MRPRVGYSVRENLAPHSPQLSRHLLRGNSVPVDVPVGFLKKINPLELILRALKSGEQIDQDDVLAQTRKILSQITKRSVDVQLLVERLLDLASQLDVHLHFFRDHAQNQRVPGKLSRAVGDGLDVTDSARKVDFTETRVEEPSTPSFEQK